jgi:light-regulated signal transduction histidine kinase (bacteriophytochrome)
VARDLRAPLRWIEGFSQILVEDHAANLGADGLRHVQRIRGAVERMGQLIRDLLQLAQVGRADLERQPVDLALMGRALIGELRQGDRTRRLDVVVPDTLVMHTDEKLVQIALHNLLANAWKFTSKISPSRIELGRTTVDGADVCFVRDNGAGFDMAYANRLFGPFQRLHGSGEFAGTGLGLVIVQRAIERVGGRIWAESEVGRGATFFFTVAP